MADWTIKWGEWEVYVPGVHGSRWAITNDEVLPEMTYDTGFGGEGDAPGVIWHNGAPSKDRINASSDGMRDLLDLKAIVEAMIEAQEEHDEQYEEPI